VNLESSGGGLVGELSGTVAGLVMALGLVDVDDYCKYIIIMKRATVRRCDYFFLCAGCWVWRVHIAFQLKE
jgi:hypothetical protein